MHPFSASSKSRRFDRGLQLASVLLAGALGLSGCQSITADSLNAAQVRFVDASVDAPALDFYLNGGGSAYNLSFGTVTSYVAAGTGESRISANRANTAQTLASARASLVGTRQYTAVVSNTLGSLQETIYPDANAPAPAGMISIRILNEAAGLGPVDVYLVPNSGSLTTTAPLVRDLGYTGNGGYLDVPAGASYSVTVLAAGAATSSANGGLTSGVSVNGPSGAVRTVVLSDAQIATGKRLDGLVLDDFETP